MLYIRRLNSEVYFRDARTRWTDSRGQLLFARINSVTSRPPIVRRFTTVCFDRAALSFGASRNFISTEPNYLSELHDNLFFARTPFAKILLTPLFSKPSTTTRVF
jgi:hypothetical protein